MSENTTEHSCDNCLGIDPTSCWFAPRPTDTERDERLREARRYAAEVRATLDPSEPWNTHTAVVLDDEVTRLSALLAERDAQVPECDHAAVAREIARTTAHSPADALALVSAVAALDGGAS